MADNDPNNGGGRSLGGGASEPLLAGWPNAPEPTEQEEETAIRQITFWRDGFSFEDGPLMRYDDPQNARLLDDINTGHAPPPILNVRVGQLVELRVLRRLDEDYVPSHSSAAIPGTIGFGVKCFTSFQHVLKHLCFKTSVTNNVKTRRT